MCEDDKILAGNEQSIRTLPDKLQGTSYSRCTQTSKQSVTSVEQSHIRTTRKRRSENVDEIDTKCQFYQQFTSSFCADFLSTKNDKPKP